MPVPMRFVEKNSWAARRAPICRCAYGRVKVRVRALPCFVVPVGEREESRSEDYYTGSDSQNDTHWTRGHIARTLGSIMLFRLATITAWGQTGRAPTLMRLECRQPNRPLLRQPLLYE